MRARWPENMAIRRADIYDVQGRRIRTLVPTGSLPDRSADLLWDGRTDLGTVATPGVYVFRIEGAGTTLSGQVVRVN